MDLTPTRGDIIDTMTDSVLIRNLPPGVKQRLRERAAAHGRSLEAEARTILVDTVFPGDFVLAWLDAAETLPPGDELETPARTADWEPVDFG